MPVLASRAAITAERLPSCIPGRYPAAGGALSAAHGHGGRASGGVALS
jgi:hypothetical protein